MSKKILFINTSKLMGISAGVLLVIFCMVGMSFTPEDGEGVTDPSDSTYVSGPRRSHWTEDNGCGTDNKDEKDYARITATAGANGSVKIENTTTKGSLSSKTSKTASAGTSQNWDWDCNKKTDGHTNTFKLTATPSGGYLLDHWEVVVEGGSPTNVSGATNPYSYTMTIPNGTRGSNRVTTYESTSNRYTVQITAVFVLDQSVDLTFIAPDGKATITVSGGTSATVTNTNVTKTGINSDVTLNISNIASGYVFAGWYQVNGNGVVTDLSTATSYTYRFTDNVSVGVRLISTSTPKFKNTSTGTEYYGLNAALTTAASGQVVVPVSNCTVDGSDLLSQENNTYTIPGGVTLLVPYESGNTSNKAIVPRVSEADVTPDCYRTLTLGANVRLDVNGAIEVGGEQNDAGQTQKATGGPRTHGRMIMLAGSTMTFNSGSSLYAWGYITGTGSITMKSGSSDYECLQMMDWVGGTLGSSLLNNSNKVFPINQYYVQNVEVPITFEYGSKCLLSTAVNLSGVGDVPADNVSFISNGDGFFNLQSGTTLLREYGLSNDRQIYTINGNASMDKLYLNLQATVFFATMGVELYSEKYRMPLTNNITINVVSGTTSINYDIVMNAGAEVNIEKGATVTIASSSTAVMYDSLEWGNYAKGAKIWPLKYAPGRTYTSATASGRTGSNLGDAVVNVKGTLNVAGSLYTTTTGARIFSDDVNQGRIVLSKAAPSSNLTVYQLKSTASTPDYESQTATAAKLRNANGSYTETTGAATGNIDYRNGHWGWKVEWKESADASPTKTAYCYKNPDNVTSWINNNKPSDPTRTGYTFTGWSQTSDNTTYQERVYVAQWTPQEYAITYKDQGDADFSGTHGSGYPTKHTYNTATTLVNPSKTGYTFDGWFTSADCLGSAVTSLGATAYTADITLYAKWTVHTHKFAWDFAGGSTSSTTHTAANNALAYGSAISYPANNTMTKTGYTFAGWSSSATSMPDEDLTITANWNAVSYHLTYEGLNGATNSNPTTYTIETATFSLANPGTRTGYNFTGWTCGGSAITQIAKGSTGDKTITANWTPNNFDVTFDMQGHGVAPAAQSIAANGKVSKPSDPSAENYRFDGWYKEPACTNAWDFASDVVTADMILYAKWTRLYTITWKVDGVTTKTEQVAEGTTPSYGDDPTKAETAQYTYSFSGWSPTPYAADKDQIYSGSFNASVHYYTITWKNWNGVTLKTDNLQYGATPSYSGTTPTKTDSETERSYTFKGWSPEVVDVAGDATYTAQFDMALTIGEGEHPYQVSGEETATITTVLVQGALKVPDGNNLTTNDLIIKASADNSGDVEGVENVSVTGHAYFDYEFNVDAWHWSAFGVPFEIDLDEFAPLKEKTTLMVLGTDYDIVYYNTTARAQRGTNKRNWEYVENHEHKLIPGMAYLIAFNHPVGHVNTVRFTKASSAPINYTTAVPLTVTGTKGGDNNWNGIANPKMYHALLDAGVEECQVHDGGPINGDGYDLYTMKSGETDYKFFVGKAAFVQTPQSQSTVEIDPATNQSPLAKQNAPRRAGAFEAVNPKYDIRIAPIDGEMADRLFIRAEEGKEDDYVIVADLAKAGVSPARAQIWVDRYGYQLCKNTTALINDMATYPLGISVPQAGEYSLYMANEVAEDDNLYLTYDGRVIWNLGYAPYVLSLEKGVNEHYGLRLIHNTPAMEMDVEQVEATRAAQKMLIDQKVYILRGEQLYSITGQKAE